MLPWVVLVAAATRCRALGPGTSGGYDWRFFAAGGISAAVSHGYTTPLDVIKTRMQTNPELYNGSVPVAIREIIETEGALFLLSGLLPTCVGYGVEGALKFGFYEFCKPIFATVSSSEVTNLLLASVVAGAIASVVLCPAEDVRIRLVSEPTYASSAIDAFRKRVVDDGPLASFSALPAMISKQVPYTMGKQVSFDFMCELVHATLVALFAGKTLESLDSFTPAIAALPAAVVACVLSHPGDTVLTEFFKSGPHPNGVLGSLAALVEDTANTYGAFRALFTGIKARLLHVIGIIWIQLVIYDKIKQLLGLPATGH
ncbi:hypothetical protein CTAYLR_009403 [Chrysophaeum taylorii]|uniref:Uncharacterized protein n=1 Tax=Chrysophaeum taylorii TaxID=2483200 RepID=A0AAD7UIV9_9STRA|nr:hypothetical protein CTAYLR_009403 [Chrysophaeum taylorii]